jgi:hypothetical protein
MTIVSTSVAFLLAGLLALGTFIWIYQLGYLRWHSYQGAFQRLKGTAVRSFSRPVQDAALATASGRVLPSNNAADGFRPQAPKPNRGDGASAAAVATVALHQRAKQMTKETVVAVSGDLTLADLGGEAVILNLKTGKYFGLNETGTKILALLKEPKPVGVVIDALINDYDVPVEQAERDILGFLSKMEKSELIHARTEVSI